MGTLVMHRGVATRHRRPLLGTLPGTARKVGWGSMCRPSVPTWVTDVVRHARARSHAPAPGTLCKSTHSTPPRAHCPFRPRRLRAEESLELDIARRRLRMDNSRACRWCCSHAHVHIAAPLAPPDPAEHLATVRVVRSGERQACMRCNKSMSTCGRTTVRCTRTSHSLKNGSPTARRPHLSRGRPSARDAVFFATSNITLSASYACSRCALTA